MPRASMSIGPPGVSTRTRECGGSTVVNEYTPQPCVPLMKA
jgi:hypothetical protein